MADSVRVKIIAQIRDVDVLTDKVNDFIKDKNVLDIKLSSDKDSDSCLIIYKINEEENNNG